MFRLLNFSSGEYKKANIGNILYTVVSLLLIFLSLYASTVWTFRISGELFRKVGIASNAVFGTFAAAIPVAFLGWFDFIFARRFVILVKNNK